MKFFTLHAHFYQPPRENPWFDEVEKEPSASPYHDWNEKITVECYEPNIINYGKISFNFGPTLLRWIEKKAPDLYFKIIEADKASIKDKGEGNAIAQCYTHLIMPLATDKDKLIQVRWGIKDFEFRFGRRPKGMWLPEMAVDTNTLRVLADEGIEFTILSPQQIKVWRNKKDEKWSLFDVDFYPFPLWQKTGPEKGINIFVYHRALGDAAAFGDLLKDRDSFINGVEFFLSYIKKGLLHFATDGETFGHHKKDASEVLKSALEALEKKIKLTNYSAFLKLFPSTKEVMIKEMSSWSCPHGVERWRKDCGCSTAGEPGWNQKWRAPFREAMEWLKTEIDKVFDKIGSRLLKEPWEALLDYVDILVKGKKAHVKFFSDHAKVFSDLGKIQILKLMEMQRMAQLMFTSCGWFFADISGLEAIYNMRCAARAIELAKELNGVSLEERYTNMLSFAKSNIPSEGTARDIYYRRVLTHRLHEDQIAAHYLIRSALSYTFKEERLLNHNFLPEDVRCERRFGTMLYIGKLKMKSTVTLEEREFTFVVLVYHQQDLHCAIKRFLSQKEHIRLCEHLFEAYKESITKLVREIDKVFGSKFYGVKDLITIF